jgi:structure-specific recognition protein 1
MSVLNFENIYLGGQNSLNEMGKFKVSNVGMGFKSSTTSEITTISQADIQQLSFQQVARNYQLKIVKKNHSVARFDGFERDDYDTLNVFVKQNFDKNIELKQVSKRGYNWGECEFDEKTLVFEVHGTEAFEIPLDEVANTATAGKLQQKSF